MCNRCKNHDKIYSIKGHKCEYNGCDCAKCQDYDYRRKKRTEMAKQRLLDKKSNNSNDVSVAQNSFVKSLKAKTKLLSKKKSIQLLNKSAENVVKSDANNKMKEKIAKKLKKKKSSKVRNVVDEIENNETHVIDMENTLDGTERPPQLIPEIPLLNCNQNTSTIVPNEECVNSGTTQLYPAKTSAAVCAQYLKAGEELSRRLLKYSLTEDELMGCLKYSLISYCLGDVDMAAQNIIFASNEIRSGALYNIQHPNEEPNNKTSNNTNTSHSNQTNTAHNSTFNVNNYRPNAINYNPTFTPVHHN